MKSMIVLGAGSLLALAMVSLTGVFGNWQVSAAVIAGALAGIAWLYRFDRRREVDAKERAAADQEDRFRELSALADLPHFELHIAGSSQLWLGIAFAIAAGIALPVAAASESPAWALGGAVALAFGLMLFIGTLPTLGKPKISITRLGFQTPLTPFVPWKEVQGIDLEQHTHRGRLMFHRVQFLLPSLPLEIARFALFHRLIHLFRTKAGKQQLHVVLRNPSEHPKVVYRLMRHLWTQSTGRSHVWMPSMPETFNAALRQLDEATAQLQKDALAGLPPPKPGDARDPARMFAESSAVISSEMRRKARILRWIVAAGLVVFLLYLAAAFVSGL